MSEMGPRRYHLHNGGRNSMDAQREWKSMALKISSSRLRVMGNVISCGHRNIYFLYRFFFFKVGLEKVVPEVHDAGE